MEISIFLLALIKPFLIHVSAVFTSFKDLNGGGKVKFPRP